MPQRIQGQLNADLLWAGSRRSLRFDPCDTIGCWQSAVSSYIVATLRWLQMCFCLGFFVALKPRIVVAKHQERVDLNDKSMEIPICQSPIPKDVVIHSLWMKYFPLPRFLQANSTNTTPWYEAGEDQLWKGHVGVVDPHPYLSNGNTMWMSFLHISSKYFKKISDVNVRLISLVLIGLLGLPRGILVILWPRGLTA